jgi:hypothetical protein
MQGYLKIRSLIDNQEKHQNILEILFLISLFSIFITYTYLYPFIFFLLITYIFLTEFIKNPSFKKIYNSNIILWQKFLIGFLFWVLLISLFNWIQTPKEILIKIFLNLSFLMVIPILIKKVKLERFIKRIFYIVEIILVLTFVQLLFIYIKLGIFVEIFTNGISNSSMAYIVTSEPSLILFGSIAKNIWATKIVFVLIIYLIGISKKIYTPSIIKSSFIITIGIINTGMSLGRTAQLALFIVLLFFCIKKVLLLSNKKIKFTISLLFSLSAFLILSKIIDKIFHINFNITDGGYIRLKYWYVFFTNFYKEDFLLGNGLLSARFFLEKYSTDIYLGESNMHNIWLNTILDWGLIGSFLYIGFYLTMSLKFVKIFKFYDFIFLIFIPFNIIVCLQYLGYDNDIVIFLSLLIIIQQKLKKNFQTFRVGEKCLDL